MLFSNDKTLGVFTQVHAQAGKRSKTPSQQSIQLLRKNNRSPGPCSLSERLRRRLASNDLKRCTSISGFELISADTPCFTAAPGGGLRSVCYRRLCWGQVNKFVICNIVL
jgi:hypothetical protein